MPSPPLLLLHGLGADSSCFRQAFEAPGLADREILAPDLPGFGGRHLPPGVDGSLESQAEHLAGELRARGFDELAILGHSMGGALGILLAERLPGRVTAFVNAVGNLVPEDCFWSREAAAQPPDAFVRGGFPRFREAIRAMPARGRRPSTYEHSLERCDPAVFHRLSSDLVSLCEHGDLLGRWLRLPCRKVYLRDSDHAPAPALLDALRHAGVPVVLVPHSGHALMEHAPEFFYAAVARFLAGQTL